MLRRGSLIVEAHFRPEIQGLRAIAVIFVMLFHIWPDSLPGGYVGVDVFFVVSGFLITGGLLREANLTGSIRLLEFYARRARRLLPAATLVLAVVAIATPLLPETRWAETAFQIGASAIYLQNWALAWLSSDYLASADAASPVQHYWSLSIEEQFYIVWPILLVAGVYAARRFEWSIRTIFAVTLSMVFLASFLRSVQMTAVEPERAYFVTSTRIWELALGGLLSLTDGRVQLLRRSRAIIGFVGLVGVAAAALLMSARTPFPGAAALVPTIGAAVIILAGSGQGLSAGTLLNRWPLQYIGDRSYSIYLWHWPLIVFYGVLIGRELNWFDGIIIVTCTLVVSHFSFLFVETSLRRGRWPAKSPSVSLGCGFASILACLTLAGAIEAAASWSARSADPMDHLAQAKRDIPASYKMGCHQKLDLSDAKTCTFGDVTSQFHIMVAGDSHAAQWLPALEKIAEKRNWKLTALTKAACPLAQFQLRHHGRYYRSCEEWRKNALELIRDISPNVLITSQSRFYARAAIRQDRATIIEQGLEKTWRGLIELGIDVIAIRDTPNMGKTAPNDCLSARQGNCAVHRDYALRGTDPIVAATIDEPGVRLIDMTDSICGAEHCEPITRNMLVWRDEHHLTATYAASLSDILLAYIEPLYISAAQLQ